MVDGIPLVFYTGGREASLAHVGIDTSACTTDLLGKKFAPKGGDYRTEMRRSYLATHWTDLLSQRRAILTCDCERTGCHRFQLAEFLKRCGAVYLGEIDKAEWSAHWLEVDRD